ncbi:MAG: hypothetical protein H7061_12525 [Bdellovibrionaceae bacterium]|nr:hypothetical protein [Bdellovibrio sp.]
MKNNKSIQVDPRGSDPIANEELIKSTPNDLAKAHQHANTSLDFDYQDRDSYEQPIRNSQRGYAPIDAPKPELEQDQVSPSK